jgi:hypothetical protein
MRVWAGALTEAACSVETYLPLHRPLDDDDDDVLHDRCDVWRISARLCPAITSGRSWVGMFAERSVPTPPAACCASPLAPPFLSRLLPLRACISLPSVCPSLPLFCARRAPAKTMRNAEISNISRGPRSMCDLKNLIGAPPRANRCRELPRGRRVFVWWLVLIRD